VFDLLNNEDGTMPIRMKRTDVLDEKGKPTGEYNEEFWPDRDGNAVHRDFAPDDFEVAGRGEFRGQLFSPGWMRQVPDDTPIGIYPEDTVFGEAGIEKKAPMSRQIRPQNIPANSPAAAPIRGKTSERVRRSA
jgi:hypothetical protein